MYFLTPSSFGIVIFTINFNKFKSCYKSELILKNRGMNFGCVFMRPISVHEYSLFPFLNTIMKRYRYNRG